MKEAAKAGLQVVVKVAHRKAGLQVVVKVAHRKAGLQVVVILVRERRVDLLDLVAPLGLAVAQEWADPKVWVARPVLADRPDLVDRRELAACVIATRRAREREAVFLVEVQAADFLVPDRAAGIPVADFLEPVMAVVDLVAGN
jgi:GAF domain-containing protein